ncbi:PWWP domain-containing protein 2A [Pungitius pungitius]|uniref:PWWP domain-containing protein 2A n=1 Tax=Pungitius pungitius TaxID=134920 RepID=UPI002E165F53
MAAVAAEPGAVAISITIGTESADDERSSEPGPIALGLPGALLETDGSREYDPAVELLIPRVEDGGEVEERRHVRPELQSAAGKDNVVNDELTGNFPVDRFSPGLPRDAEGGGVYRSILGDPQSSAVFLHSFPANPPVTEAGLSLAEPAEPTTNVTAGRDRGYRALVQPELRPGPVEAAMSDGDRLSVLEGLDPETESGKNSGGGEELPVRSLRDSSPSYRSAKRRLTTDTIKQEKPTAEDYSRPEPGPELDPHPPGPEPSVAAEPDLNPGSEVRVSLDHVIDDALVVSFRLGPKVFSGVLMDVSKRFGPYGIPITVFPRRDDQSRPQMFVQSPAIADPSISPDVTSSPLASPPLPPWTSKPPPLFQDGAAYPPPLFIRDTYNQALPQPLPRKIKRPKRRYRCEEPTSIMNAIKLRPRQVLCDKCKGVVASGGHRESRRGAGDLRGEDTSRRRRPAEGPLSTEVKRLRSDDKGGRPADRRPSPGLHVSSSSRRVLRGGASSSPSSSRQVLKGVASSSPSSSRMCLNPKKVLAKGPAIHCSEARQVLKKLPPRRPKDQNQNQTQDQDDTKAVTRAAALQNHNQKVHFTRRLQHLSGSSVGSSALEALPPRMRLKPQRYRTDDSQESTSSPPHKQSPRSSPPKPSSSPELEPPQALPPPSPTTCFPTPPSTSCTSSLENQQQGEEGGNDGQVAAPPHCSLDSSHSECSSTETFELAPPGDPHCSSSHPPTPKAGGAEEVEEEEEEDYEDGSELKRRRKSSTSSSSSSSSSSVFSKLVSKCSLPDGRSVCVGDIVWAKIYGFPWWPARVLCITVSRRGDTGLSVRQEARVSWFGSPTTSFLPLTQLSPFLESFQSRFDRKRKGPYRRAIAEAASAAKQLTPEVRALLTQFET